jgi:hypothetical protein
MLTLITDLSISDNNYCCLYYSKKFLLLDQAEVVHLYATAKRSAGGTGASLFISVEHTLFDVQNRFGRKVDHDA